MNIKTIFEPFEQITFEDYMVKCGVKNVATYTSANYLEPLDHYDNIRKAAQIISNAIDNREHIYVLLDEDMDGMMTTVIQYIFLKRCNPNLKVTVIVHKTPKSHGLQDKIVMQDLLNMSYGIEGITTNIGVLWIGDASSNEVDLHKQLVDLGWKVVVTDHHDKVVDNNVATVVSNLFSKNVENKSLSGAGVTFKLCQAIDELRDTHYSRDLISFVHISNISDSREFINPEQHTFRYWGLQAPYCTLKPFINAFNYNGGLDNKSFSFGLISRINAVIRVGTIEQKQKVFLALADGSYMSEALEICKKCKAEQDKQVNEILENGLTLQYNGQINIYETDTPTPLTGLIANKLQDRDNRTVFVVHNFNGEMKGSCRSPYDEKDVNIRQLCEQSNEFYYASGHGSAFGISWNYLNSQDIANWIWSLTLSEPNIATLGSWTTKSIPKYLFSEFGANTSLYGQGIKDPLVHIHSITVNQGDIREMGANGRTLKLSKDGIEFMWFRISNADKEKLLNTPYELELVGTMRINEWNGRKTPQIIVEKYEIKDLKKKTLEDIF